MKKQVKVSAPGKIIIHGEHAVVYGRAAFAGCINKRLYCAIEKIENSEEICLKSLSVENSITQSFNKSFLLQHVKGCFRDARSPSSLAIYNWEAILNGLAEEKRTDALEVAVCRIWIGLVLCIASKILEECDYGLSVEVSSELPYGAGLGSSATLSACTATALLLFFGIINPVVVNSETSALQYSLSDEDLSLISGWAFEAEKLIHGTPSGIDNSVITFGGALLYSKGQMEFFKSLPPVQILLVNTGVSRKTSEIVAGVRARYNQVPETYNATFDAMQKCTEESLSNLLSLKQALQDDQNEDCCNKIYEKLTMLIGMNQHLLRAIGVSHESIDDVIRILGHYNLKGKLTGAGGGGCVFTLIRPGVRQSVIDGAMKELSLAGYDSWITQLGCDGIKCHSFVN